MPRQQQQPSSTWRGGSWLLSSRGFLTDGFPSGVFVDRPEHRIRAGHFQIFFKAFYNVRLLRGDIASFGRVSLYVVKLDGLFRAKADGFPISDARRLCEPAFVELKVKRRM